MSSIYKIAGVQMDIKLAEIDANRTAMAARLMLAREQDASVIVFPECATTGYCFESFDEAMSVAESANGPTWEFFQEICAAEKCYTVYGFLEQKEGKLFNSLNLIGPDGLVGTYRKIHLPFLGVDRFTSVGDSFEVYDLGFTRIGMHICYDGSFPESSRCLAIKGADVLVLPTNWPPGALAAADVIPNARSMENHAYFISVNRVGSERGFDFIGKSKICDCDGIDIVFENHQNESIFIAEVDSSIPRNKKLVRVPGKHEIDRFEDRHPEKYAAITRLKHSEQ